MSQQSPEQYAAAVLSRSSVLDLREAQPADILRLADKTDGLEILRSGQIGYFNFATVSSGERVHEVRLFENWMFCDCEAFYYRVILQYSTSTCRHAVYAFSQIDPRSFNRICDQERFQQGSDAISAAVYAPPVVKTERIGSIPI